MIERNGQLHLDKGTDWGGGGGGGGGSLKVQEILDVCEGKGQGRRKQKTSAMVFPERSCRQGN